MKLKACRKCKTLTYEKVCPKCGSKDLTLNWKGIVIILNLEKSEIARILNIKEEGVYAMVVR